MVNVDMEMRTMMRKDRGNKVADCPVDAVFVIGGGSMDGNLELRYALRNLDAHCKFIRDVYICGECPAWVDKTMVKHLQWPDRFSHAKDANIIDKLRHACECRGIAKRILFCSDDQFQTRECTWDDFAPRYLRRYRPDDKWYANKKRPWHRRLRGTLERDAQRRRASGLNAADVFYYQPHMWMQIDRDLFLEYAKWCGYETRTDTIIASGYFNFIDAAGRPDFDHVFLVGGETRVSDVTHVAYHDGSFSSAMKILAEMFPDKSRFEIDDPPRRGHGAMVARPDPGRRWDSGEDAPHRPAVTARDMSIVSNAVKRNPKWAGIRGEVSLAEEMRLFGASGWRVVWKDIVDRWRKDTDCGNDDVEVSSPRSEAASMAVENYTSRRRVPGMGGAGPCSGRDDRPASEDTRAALHESLRAMRLRK